MKLKPNREALRLRRIPVNTVVHTPTEAEAKELLAILHENGWKWITKEPLINYYPSFYFVLYKENDNVARCDYNVAKSYSTILTLAEFKERYCEEEKPRETDIDGKFHCGDTVITTVFCPLFSKGMIGTVVQCHASDVDVAFGLRVVPHVALCDLELYTGPETKEEAKDTKDDTKGKEPRETGNNPEISQLNLCELLKGRDGESIFLTTMGEVLVEKVSEEHLFFRLKANEPGWRLNTNGKMSENGVVITFPSRVLYEQYPLDPYTAWMKWQEEQMNRKTYIQIYTVGSDGLPQAEIDDRYYFRTPADRDKCIKEIKAIIDKYSKK